MQSIQCYTSRYSTATALQAVIHVATV